MKKIDDRIIKVKVPREKGCDGLPVYPYNILKLTPPQPCVFDSYRGTIGFDVFPFSITTRISSASEVFLKVYEDYPDKHR